MNMEAQTAPVRLAWLEGVTEMLIEVVSILVGSQADPDMPEGAEERIAAVTAGRFRELGDQRAAQAILAALEQDEADQ